jgi:hypothetical protein
MCHSNWNIVEVRDNTSKRRLNMLLLDKNNFWHALSSHIPNILRQLDQIIEIME